MSWSWRRISRKYVVYWLGGGLVVGLVLGLGGGLVLGLVFGLVGGLIVGLIAGLGGGLVGGLVELKITPNEGIKNSAQNAIRVGLVSWLVVGLGGGLVYGLGGGLGPGWVVGWFLGRSGWFMGWSLGWFMGLGSLGSRLSNITLCASGSTVTAIYPLNSSPSLTWPLSGLSCRSSWRRISVCPPVVTGLSADLDGQREREL